MRRDYELGFILQPEVSEERTRSILDRIEQIVTRHNGQVVRVNHWGRRRLAYPIQHHRDGIYVFVDMIVSPETLPELDRILKVSEEVLRHLIKRRDPRVVQKERESYAAGAAASASPAATATISAEAALEPALAETMGVEAVETAPIVETGQAATAVNPADLSDGSSEVSEDSSEVSDGPSDLSDGSAEAPEREAPEAEAPAPSSAELEGAPPALAEQPAGESEG